MVSSRGPKVRHQNLFTRFCAPLNRLHFSSPPASCAPLFCRPWCLNSHSALHIASFSKRKKIKIFLFLGQSLQIRFCNFTKKEGRTHLQSIYKKGRYGLGLARACVNEQHWMDLVGWGTKEDINSVLAPFSGGFQLTNHAMPYQLALLAASYKLMCMIIKSTRYLYLSSSKHDVAALPAYVSKCFHTHVIICHFQIPVFIWDVQLHLAISPLTFIVTIIV